MVMVVVAVVVAVVVLVVVHVVAKVVSVGIIVERRRATTITITTQPRPRCIPPPSVMGQGVVWVE